MKIQIVSNNNLTFETNHKITNSTLNKPLSLDSFDINIFSLQHDKLWAFSENTDGEIFCSNDLESIKKMINTSKKSINIVALPQNYIHYYSYWKTKNDYQFKIELKNEIINLRKNLLSSIIPNRLTNSYELIYENSETVLNNKSFVSAFCFVGDVSVLTRANGSNKATTIKFDKLILTTLDLQSQNSKFDDFIKGIGLDNQKVELPQWVIDYKCFDDEQQQELIAASNREIGELNRKIEQANIKIDENLRYKSILTINGNELVKVIFEMLEKMLDYSLADFVDENVEDFLIKKADITFVGEIKGVTSNVKSEHIGQLDTHYHTYIDKLDEEKISENVKAILIINPFRTKPLSEREEVHEKQINLAKRNGSLIITTETFLKIFELFQNGEISSERIMSVFCAKIGLLTIDNFYEENKKVDNSVYKV